jgi:anti-sigma B factor antagonist
VQLRCRRDGSGVVLDLTGHCSVGPGEEELLEFRSTIERLIREGQTQVAVDLRALQSLDARGLGELVIAWRLLRAAGGSLLLRNPNQHVKKLLAVTRLDTVLPVYDATGGRSWPSVWRHGSLGTPLEGVTS